MKSNADESQESTDPSPGAWEHAIPESWAEHGSDEELHGLQARHWAVAVNHDGANTPRPIPDSEFLADGEISVKYVHVENETAIGRTYRAVTHAQTGRTVPAMVAHNGAQAFPRSVGHSFVTAKWSPLIATDRELERARRLYPTSLEADR